MNRNQCLVFVIIFLVLGMYFDYLMGLFIPCSLESDVCDIKSTIYASFAFISFAVVLAFSISGFLEKKR